MILERVPYLQVIPEDIVETYFQTLYASFLHFFLLQIQQIVFARSGNVDKSVEFFVDSIGYDPSFVEGNGRVFDDLFVNTVLQFLADVELLTNLTYILIFCLQTSFFYGFQGL